jgi:tRNA threonylcarbamoyladenosine biosynthesis protein TsaB
MLLAFETATSTCGAAVLVDGVVVSEAHIHRPRIHARHLTPLAEQVLAQCETSAQELDAVAVSMGPGSYTGLRIGVSTAKGFAMATGAALIGVPTLEALAATVLPYAADDDVICALIDARRDEVYAAAYQVQSTTRTEPAGTSEGSGLARLVMHAAADAMEVGQLPDWLGAAGKRLWLVGTGAAKSYDTLRPAHRTRVVPDEVATPSAAWVARCAAHRLARGQTTETDTFEPMYLKAFQTG